MSELLAIPDEELVTDINGRFKINISYSQAWRGKCYALEVLRGSPEASSVQLPAFVTI